MILVRVVGVVDALADVTGLVLAAVDSLVTLVALPAVDALASVVVLSTFPSFFFPLPRHDDLVPRVLHSP